MNVEKMLLMAYFLPDENARNIVYMQFLDKDKNSPLPQLTCRMNNNICTVDMLENIAKDTDSLEKAIADFYEGNVDDNSHLRITNLIDKEFLTFDLIREIENAKMEIYKATSRFAGNTILINPESFYYPILKEINHINIKNIIESHFINPESIFVLEVGEDMITFPAVCYCKPQTVKDPAQDKEITLYRYLIKMLNPKLIRKISLFKDLSE